MRRALLAVSLLAVAAAAPARAAPAPGAVRALARAALTDPAALARLRRIDGLGRVLATSSRAELDARLRVLAAPGPARAAPIASPRNEAKRILHGRRFHGSQAPRPFHGALVWLGRRLRPVGRAFRWLDRQLPGGSWFVWTLLAAAVLAASAIVATRTARRRGDLRLEQLETRRAPGAPSPGALEREADAAEAAGDYERALRLRFRAGLLRLGRARVVPLRDSLTSGEVRRILRLPEFDVLARTHDEVVYGGRPVAPGDAAAARDAWPRVLAASRVRR